MGKTNKLIIMLELNSVFDEVKNDCLKVLEKHISKGDSWKTCSISHLRTKLSEEYQEVIDSDSLSEAEELLDLINIAVMLRKRLVS